MTNDIVCVVTGLDFGWNCIVGVFAGVSREELEQTFPNNEYVITQIQVETNCIAYK